MHLHLVHPEKRVPERRVFGIAPHIRNRLRRRYEQHNRQPANRKLHSRAKAEISSILQTLPVVQLAAVSDERGRRGLGNNLEKENICLVLRKSGVVLD